MDDFSEYDIMTLEARSCDGANVDAGDQAHPRLWLPENLTFAQRATLTSQRGLLVSPGGSVYKATYRNYSLSGGVPGTEVNGAVPMAAGAAFYGLKLFAGILSAVTARISLRHPAARDRLRHLAPRRLLHVIQVKHVYSIFMAAAPVLALATMSPLAWTLSYAFDQTEYKYTVTDTWPWPVCSMGSIPVNFAPASHPTAAHLQYSIFVMTKGGTGAAGVQLFYPIICSCMLVFLCVGHAILLCRLRAQATSARAGHSDEPLKPKGKEVCFTTLLLVIVLAACVNVVMFMIYIGVTLEGPQWTNLLTLNVEGLFDIGIDRKSLSNLSITEIFLYFVTATVEAAYSLLTRPCRSDVMASKSIECKAMQSVEEV